MYKFNVWYDGGWLHEEKEFDTYEEALDEARAYIENTKDYWDAEKTEYEEQLFGFEIEDY